MKTKKRNAKKEELFPLLVRYSDWITGKRWWRPLIIVTLLVTAMVSALPSTIKIAVKIAVITGYSVFLVAIWLIPGVIIALPDDDGCYPPFIQKVTWKNFFGVMAILTFLFFLFDAIKGELIWAFIFATLMTGNIFLLWMESIREKMNQ